MTAYGKVVATILAVTISFEPAGLIGQVPSPPPAPASTSVAPQDKGWPRQLTGNAATLLYYQPQIDDWKNYKDLLGRVAFSLTPQGSKSVLGVASLETHTSVDNENRTVSFKDLKYTSIRFQSLDPEQSTKMEELFRSIAPIVIQPVSLDRVLADLDRSKVSAQPVEVKNDPPQIFYSSSSAILLTVQGQPALNPIEKTDLESVINTNWDLFFDKKEKRFYLLVTNIWFTSTALTGPWAATTKLPKDMSKLPAGQNWDPVKAMVPPPASSVPPPQIFFSDKPAELILTKGAPVYTRIPGTQLLYVTNTENDLFLDNANQQYYVLLSGRWFHAGSFAGPWSYAGNNLPADFAKIPDTSPKARVLASVPGTVEASDAVMLAQIPTTVVVNRAEAESKVKVAYDGQPSFAPIEGTSLEYATNTQEKIIRDGNDYYLCYQGVWFISSSPNGPWKVADFIPQEIYKIPPSSPLYNVTYVTQTNPTETTVESSTTAGYYGMLVLGMTAGMCIGFGTGYYYPPYMYWGPGAMYPIYRPWPPTYGAGYVYNPWTGGWAAGRSVYGPYGAAGSSAWYNPATGRYGRAASAQGWYGGRTVAGSYNPWTGGFAATSQGHNTYAQWGTSVAGRNGQAIQTGHITTANGTAAGYRTSNGQRGGVVTGDNGTVVKGPNSVYAGNDGNVYRKDTSGTWSKYDNGNWSPVDTSAAKQQVQQNFQSNHPQAKQNAQNAIQNRQQVSPGTMQGLDRSAAARQRGQMQTQRFQNFHRGGGMRFRR